MNSQSSKVLKVVVDNCVVVIHDTHASRIFGSITEEETVFEPRGAHDGE